MLRAMRTPTDAARFAEISNRLRQARKAKGLTQIQAAEALGVSRMSYSRLESGYHRVEDYLQAAANAFDVEFDWLSMKEDDRKSEQVADLYQSVLYVDEGKLEEIMDSRSWRHARKHLKVYRDFEDPEKVVVLGPDLFVEGGPEWTPLRPGEALKAAKSLQTRLIEYANHLHQYPEDEIKEREKNS